MIVRKIFSKDDDMPVKVAEEWLNICDGCEVTILDIGEKLLDLLPNL